MDSGTQLTPGTPAAEAPASGNILTRNFINPYPVYAELRKGSPVLRDDRSGGYVVVSEALVREVLSQPERYLERAHRAGVLIAAKERGIDPGPPIRRALSNDPEPYHSVLRGVAMKSFSPARIRAMEPEIRGYAEELIEKFRPGETVDFAAEFAVPFPARVIAHLLGVPVADHTLFKDWTVGLLTPDREVWQAAMDSFAEYFAPVIARRRREPLEHDMPSDLAQAVDLDGNPLSDGEITEVLALMVLAGSETTTHLLTNSIAILCARPEIWDQLASGEVTPPRFVEEALRTESPVQWVPRTVAADTELGGVRLEAGSTLFCMTGAANRDESAFDDAEQLRLDRRGSRHMAFGHGIHNCVGAPLARLEGRLPLQLLVERFAGVEAAGPALLSQTFVGTHGFGSQPVTFRARTTGEAAGAR